MPYGERGQFSNTILQCHAARPSARRHLPRLTRIRAQESGRDGPRASTGSTPGGGPEIRVIAIPQAAIAPHARGDFPHACRDGEIAGSGRESTADLTVQFDVIKGERTRWPRLETEERIIVAGRVSGAAAEGIRRFHGRFPASGWRA